MTPEEIEQRSNARATANRRRFIILAVFMFAIFLALAGLLQIQQQRLETLVHQMCLQRQANTIRSNEIWAELASIEQHNRFIDDTLRQQRLTVYQNAKLTVPVCT